MMNQKRILSIILSITVIVSAAALVTLTTFAENPDNKNFRNIDNLNIEIVGSGDFVKQNKNGDVVLDGAKIIKINLSNAYEDIFNYSLNKNEENITNVISTSKMTRAKEIDLTDVFVEMKDGEYILVITAFKKGQSEPEETNIVINIETIESSISFNGDKNATNPESITLSANKNTDFHWQLKKDDEIILVGVGENALNKQLKNLNNGEYIIESKAFLTSKYNNTFEFMAKNTFIINNKNDD